MAETATVADSAELAYLVRSGFIESRHAGSVAVVNAEGDVVFSLGNPSAPVFPRSAMKPFQVVAMMSSGLEIDGAYAAIATASHNGSAAHVALVRDLLARAGLTDDALQCAKDMPGDKAMRNDVIKRDGGAERIYHCCSGKHAAMLLTCVQNEWPIDSYMDPEHPLQKRVVEVIDRLTGEKISISAVDGCGAPVHAMSLIALARGIRAITTSSTTSPFGMYRASAVLTQAMLANPWVVGAHGEPDTLIMERLGFVAKAGYEGVFIVSTPDGTTAAVRVLDGNLRAAPAIALQALVRAGALEQARLDALLPDLDMTVYGGGNPVGELRTSF